MIHFSLQFHTLLKGSFLKMIINEPFSGIYNANHLAFIPAKNLTCFVEFDCYLYK